MRAYSLTQPLKRILYTFATLFFVVGCGGGGSSGPGRSPYVTVTSVTPTINSSNVDARIPSITAAFSANLDLSSFLTQGAALSKLLSAKGIQVFNVTTQKVQDPSGLTLPELVSGNYTVVVKVNGADQQTVLDSYSYVKEASGAYGLTIKLRNVTQSLDFTSQELLTSGIVNNSLFKVSSDKGLAYGEITVKDNVITFYPLNYLDWGSTYTVTIPKAVKDTEGRPLQQDYIWSFKTMALPTPAVDSVNPIGINANPIKKIWFKTNFSLDESSLNSNTVVLYKITPVTTDNPTPKQEVVESQVAFDKGSAQIVITPKKDLDYLQDYRVQVVGGGAGIKGSFGNVTGITLANDYVWDFTTAEPKVVSFSPVVVDATSPVVETNSTISVEMNFRPNPATVTSGISIRDDKGNTISYKTPEITEGVIKLTPSKLLDYNTLYTVTVSSALTAAGNPNVRPASPVSYSFKTVERKIISQSPVAGTSGNSSSAAITVSFNFDAADVFKQPSFFKVEQQVNAGLYSDITSKGMISYDSTTRKVEYFPNFEYTYNAVIRVTVGNIPSADGAGSSKGATWTFTIRNQNLTLSSSVPYNNATNVSLTNEISATMSYQLDPATIGSNALSVKDCNGRNVTGYITYDSYTIYFLPTQTLASWCTHTATVNSSVRGTKNETQTDINSWSFKTDGLAVTSVYVTYIYGSYVDVTAPIEINFNHSVSSIPYNGIYLVDSKGRTMSGTTYRYGNSIDFYPSYQLDYNEDYELVVSTSVTGLDGERMSSNSSTYFYTEDAPLDVADYGPTGLVFVDDFFWVQMAYDVSTVSASSSSIFPYVSTSISKDSYYNTVEMKPYSNLAYDTDYDIKFYMTNNSGSSLNFNWSVTTETAYSPLAAAGKKSALAAPKGSRTDKATFEGRKALGCRADKYCIGRLKTKTKAEYKKGLSGKRKVNIKPEEAQKKLKKLRGLSRNRIV